MARAIPAQPVTNLTTSLTTNASLSAGLKKGTSIPKLVVVWHYIPIIFYTLGQGDLRDLNDWIVQDWHILPPNIMLMPSRHFMAVWNRQGGGSDLGMV